MIKKLFTVLCFLTYALPAMAVPGASTAQAVRSIESFRFIGPETTLKQIIARLGEPDEDVGSGIHIFSYHLNDGTSVWVGSSDNEHIIYIKQGTDLGAAKDMVFEEK